MQKINYNSIKKVLSPREMQNITGGSIYCICLCDDFAFLGLCAGSSLEDCESYSSCSGCMNIGGCRYGE